MKSKRDTFNPSHDDGRCRWCGGKLKTYDGKPWGYAYGRFDRLRCAELYASLTLDKGVRWVKKGA